MVIVAQWGVLVTLARRWKDGTAALALARQGQPGDKASMYLDHFTADGRLHSKFRDCRGGKAYDSIEDGTWSVSGNLLTIQTNFHNGALMPRTDIYTLDAASQRGFHITYIPLKFPYDERRVDDKFEMPPCDLTS